MKKKSSLDIGRLKNRLSILSVAAAASGAFTASSQGGEPPGETVSTQIFSRGNSTLQANSRRRRASDLFAGRRKYDLVSDILGGSDECPGSPIPGGNYPAALPFIDTGNTTGANNTVGNLVDYYGYSYASAGSDQIYSFTLTARGPNPLIQVSAGSGGYQPMVYVTRGCPSGTNNTASDWDSFAIADPGGTATVGLQYLTLNTPAYVFIDSPFAGNAGPYTIRMQNVTIAPAAPPTATRKRFDFDGDGVDDVAVFRATDRTWYVDRSSNGFLATSFGLESDRLVPFDFNGDRKTDIAVFREGTWFLLDVATGTVHTRQFGLANDVPLPADFSGDGLDELAVYRAGTWWTLNQLTGDSTVVQFGLLDDRPVVGDYDGDARADHAIYRDGEWHLNRSSQGYAVIRFGLPGDVPTVGDYDGDGRTDIAVYRDGTWYLLRSSQGIAVFQFGLATDVPVPADYDGDGRTDIAVYRDGTWYILRTGLGTVAYRHFGLGGDAPLPASYIP